MDELITKQQVIDAILGQPPEPHYPSWYAEQIKELPPAEPNWIPVTERLPETTDAVLTTYIVNGDRSRRYVEESSYYWTDESWCSPWDEYRMQGTSIEAIAWMPMPAPWKGE